MIIDLATCAPLMNFLREMERQAKRYPEDSRQAEFGVHPTPHRDWYGDINLFQAMYEMQERWYSTYPPTPFQAQLRRDFHEIRQSTAVANFTYQQEVIYSVYATRRHRWEKLATYVGLPSFPETFVVYRGVHGEKAAKSVIEAWMNGEPEIGVLHSGLSSWSLLESGARHYFDAHRWGVLAKTTVPFENTLLDVLVDNGYFARHGCREAEVVIGTGSAEDRIVAPAEDVRVRVDDQEFGFQEFCGPALLIQDRFPNADE